MSKVAASGLLRRRLVAQACCGGGHWLRPVPAEVSGSGLLPRRSLPCTRMVLQKPLSQACSLSGRSLVAAPVEVASGKLFKACHLSTATKGPYVESPS